MTEAGRQIKGDVIVDAQLHITRMLLLSHSKHSSLVLDVFFMGLTNHMM